jgi:RNA polymerase sigma factor (sigma-70 family)
MSEPTDEDLMKAYQQGDEQAFQELYRRYSGKVYGFLRGKLSDERAAEDVFQATFLKLHQARSHYDPSFPFVPWLFTVCRSVLTDQFRKKARRPETLDAEAVENARAPQVEETESRVPDLGSLPTSQRAAVEMRYGEDLPFEEIAKRLETSPANVRQLISRGIRKLRSRS